MKFQVSPANPQGFVIKRLNDLLGGSTQDISLNTLRFLADNPVTGTASISFDTRKPNEGWASYTAVTDLPKEVTDKFEQFIRTRAMAETRPGTLVYNSPVPSADLLRERLREGELPSTQAALFVNFYLLKLKIKIFQIYAALRICLRVSAL